MGPLLCSMHGNGRLHSCGCHAQGETDEVPICLGMAVFGLINANVAPETLSHGSWCRPPTIAQVQTYPDRPALIRLCRSPALVPTVRVSHGHRYY